MIRKQVVKNITAGKISVYRDVLLYPVFKIRQLVNKSEEMTTQMPSSFTLVSKHIFLYILLLIQAIKQYFCFQSNVLFHFYVFKFASILNEV